VLFPGTPGLRRHVMVRPTPGMVTAELADDYHHFAVELRHDGERIFSVVARPIRFPWNLCSEASRYLEERLTGTKLARAAEFDVQSAHCTHQMDLAIAAASHAFQTGPVLYKMFVSDPKDGRKQAILHRNGLRVIDWLLQGSVILAPEPLAGRSLKKLREWRMDLPEDQREPASLLRRAAYITDARHFDFSKHLTMKRDSSLAGACYTYQAERAERAARNTGYMRDFSAGDRKPFEEQND